MTQLIFMNLTRNLGIDKDGALIVKLENKKIRKIYSGDIFIE